MYVIFLGYGVTEASILSEYGNQLCIVSLFFFTNMLTNINDFCYL